MRSLKYGLIALLLAVSLVVILVMPVAAGGTGNLLVNPDAETGDMTGWTYSSTHSPPKWDVRASQSLSESCGTVLPRSGSWFFDMGYDGAASPVWMQQTIDLTGHGGTPVTFAAGGYVQTEKYWEPGWPDPATDPGPGNYDYGYFKIEFFDGGGGSVGVFEQRVEHPVCAKLGGVHDYALFSTGTINVPDGAVSAVYRLEGWRMQREYINVFYDDLFFTLDIAETTPTPTPTPMPTPTPTPRPTPTPTVTPQPPVGGTILPTDRIGLVMPWIAAGAFILIAGASLIVWNRKRGAEDISGR